MLQAPAGPAFRAITLNIGGVNAHRHARGSLLLTYVAPWCPEKNLFCALGYGASFPKGKGTAVFLPFLGLRFPEVSARPLP